MRIIKVLAVVILILTFLGTTILMTSVDSKANKEMSVEERKEFREDIFINSLVLMTSFIAGISVYIIGFSVERLLEQQDKRK